jgi:serine protease inhibitor
MNSDKLFELLGDIDEKEIENAEKYTGRKKTGRIFMYIAPAIAASVLIIAAGMHFMRQSSIEPHQTGHNGIRIIRAVNAPSDYEDMDMDEFMNSEVHRSWATEFVSNNYASAEIQPDMSEYYRSVMENTLIADDENTVCSPLNIYLALSMLAETSGGNSRQQILDALDVSDIDQLHSNVASIWNANYVDTPAVTSLLANSVWLNDSVTFNDATLNNLATNYHSSSYVGDVESPEMSEELRKWISENTKGLLDEYADDISLTPQTVMALVSTIYYKAGWSDGFMEQLSTQEIFHGTLSDSEVTMMHSGRYMPVYLDDDFTALGLPLCDSGAMYFFLPDEGVDVNTLVSRPEIFDVISPKKEMDEHWENPFVYLAIPKFNVSEETDLLNTMSSLGITDVMDPAVSDFAPLSPDAANFYIGKAEHAAMVEVDEQGVIGTAYTYMDVRSGGTLIIENEMYFTLDRPFMFIVTGYDGSILFSGIVRNL